MYLWYASNLRLLCLFPLLPLSRCSRSPLLSSLCQPVTRTVQRVSPRAWGETEDRSEAAAAEAAAAVVRRNEKLLCASYLISIKPRSHGCVFLIKCCSFASKCIEVYFFPQYLPLLILSCLLTSLYLPHFLFSFLCLLQPFLGLWATFTYSFSHIHWLTHLS